MTDIIKCKWCNVPQWHIDPTPEPVGVSGNWQVRCNSIGCGVRGPYGLTSKSAIECWNTIMAPPDLSALVRELEAGRDKWKATAIGFPTRALTYQDGLSEAFGSAASKVCAFAAGEPPFGKENEDGR